MARGDEERLDPGTRVEVRIRFEGGWTHGFEVVDAALGGYLLRRVSDGTVLPATFAAQDLRSAHEPSRW